MLVIRIMPLCGVRDLLSCHPCTVPVAGGGDAAEFAGSEPCSKTAGHGELVSAGKAWGVSSFLGGCCRPEAGFYVAVGSPELCMCFQELHLGVAQAKHNPPTPWLLAEE